MILTKKKYFPKLTRSGQNSVQTGGQYRWQDEVGNNGKTNGEMAGGAAKGIAAAGVDIAGLALSNSMAKTQLNMDTSIDEFGVGNVDSDAIESLGAKEGAMSGMSTGAAAGGAIGMAFGPVGSAIGIVAGGAIGAGIGYFTGKNAGEEEAKKAEAARKAAVKTAISADHRNEDMLAMQSLMGKEGRKFSLPFKPNGSLRRFKPPIFKSSGKLETPGAVNIVPKGKLHKENNNLGNKDKGIPIVSATGEKEYEIERDELVLRAEATKRVEEFTAEYNANPTDRLLEDLGQYVAKELLDNTHDYSGKFKVQVA